MNECIYCRCELPSYVPREHVIPQSFGVFKPDLTLQCVCSPCNGYFGSKLEWPMLIESIEGARRLQFGLKGTVGGIGTKGVMPVVAEGEDWKGARTQIRTDKDGTESTEVLPRVGARRNPSEPFEWVLERDLTAEFAARFPKGSEFRIVGGRDEADNDRLVQKLISVCPTFVYGGKMNPPFSGDGKVIGLRQARAVGADAVMKSVIVPSASIESMRHVGSRCCGGMKKARMSTARRGREAQPGRNRID